MNMKNAMKQVVTFVLVVFVLVVLIPLVKESFKSAPGQEAHVGEIFTVVLDSDANPAFRWDLLASDETKVQLVHEPDAQEAIAKTEVWTFRALAPGEVTLYFGYIRIDSPNMVAARSHSVALTISP
ncbi:protease inhibitor I42 family protein [bacterium]|nr:protease inhibitor I42 family protein [bacterium]